MVVSTAAGGAGGSLGGKVVSGGVTGRTVGGACVVEGVDGVIGFTGGAAVAGAV